MKRAPVLLILLAAFLLPLGAQQDESPQQLINLLRRSFTDQERLNVARRMAERPTAEYAEVFTQTLRELAARRIEAGSQQDQRVKKELATILLQQLGNFRHKEAEQIFFQLSRELRDPVLRGEAYLALGRVASPASVSAMKETLLQLCDSTSRTRDEEIVAYGLVRGLAENGSLEAFPALFVASRSWFSGRSQVKQVADEAWKKMGDPTELVSAFAVSGEALRYKIIAVRYLIENPGPPQVMSQKAVEILEHGLNLRVANPVEARLLEQYTREAARLAIRFSQANPAAVEPFRRLIEQNRDPAETAALIDALARGRTEEGIAYLNGLLSQFNQRQAAGGNNDTALRQINQILLSYEAILDRRTRQVLLEFVALNYAPSLRQRAQSILDRLPRD